MIDPRAFFNHIAPMIGKNRMTAAIAALWLVVSAAYAGDWPVVPKPMLNGTISGNSLTRDTEVLTPAGIVDDVDFIPNAEPAAGPEPTHAEDEPAQMPAVISPSAQPGPLPQAEGVSLPEPHVLQIVSNTNVSITEVMSSRGMSEAPVASPPVLKGPEDTLDKAEKLLSPTPYGVGKPGKMVIRTLPPEPQLKP